eukprot:scaffold181315_cov33-Tisochrysis_lutea.AAC.1
MRSADGSPHSNSANCSALKFSKLRTSPGPRLRHFTLALRRRLGNSPGICSCCGHGDFSFACALPRLAFICHGPQSAPVAAQQVRRHMASPLMGECGSSTLAPPHRLRTRQLAMHRIF